ncbi:MAG TPA: EAL domain-containing protein, partial [Thermoanaerobaculia bacterium]|nr:EAL domain-containing protein [Thermoanaerobaculia bacterium]
MRATPIRVLLVEDNPRDRLFVEEILARSTTPFALEVRSRLAEAVARLREGGVDVLLLDLSLPDSPPAQTFARAHAAAPRVPVVVLSGHADEELALRAVRDGAQDYLGKREATPALVERALRYALERHGFAAALQESEERYALAVAGASDGIWDWNLETGLAYFSPRWKTMLGCKPDEVGARIEEWIGRIHEDDRAGVERALAAHLEGREPHFEQEMRMVRKDGTPLWALVRGLAVRDPSGRPLRMAGSLSDISARKGSEAQLLHDAFHDALTGLANRQLFLDRLGSELSQAQRRPGALFAVLFFDLDRFKNINDSLGHALGDALLVELSRRLTEILRPGDTVARLGGDEFAVLAADLNTPLDAIPIAERIQDVLRAPFVAGAGHVFSSASIGIALSSPSYTGPGEMLRDADIAMYRAKAAGRDRYEVFDETMHASAVALLRLETELRRALEQERFVMHYQPIVSLPTGRITGFEALVRWNHPERGLVPPERFIGVAEESGLIVPLGWWVLRAACRQAREWQRLHPAEPPLYMSVNVSGKIVLQPDMEERILEILEEMSLPPESLRLEITETVIMDHAAEVLRKLQRLRMLGIKFSIDDFGTGYSSLAYLQEFSYDTLKIDRSFIAGMEHRDGGSAIVQTIVALAAILHMNVVAEGVETPVQLARLREIGCPQGQGFWFSRPVDPAAAGALLGQHPPWQPRPGAGAEVVA